MRYGLFLIGIFISFNTQIFSQNPCVISDSFLVSPVAPNNTYNPGDIITVCYTLEEFDQVGSNWFEGILIDYSSGFVANSITPSSSNAPIEVVNGSSNLSCSGNGAWNFHDQINPTSPSPNTVITLFDGVQVTNDGTQSYYPGFFFENDTPPDGNPGDDFGDNDISGCSWTFCFDLEVAPY